MKRALLALLATVAVGAAVLFQSEVRARDYRRLLALGDAALAGNQSLVAIEDYSGAIALRPDSMLAHLRRGETYLQRRDLDAAARDFRVAAALDPTAARPLEQWGDVLYQQQRYRRAAEIYGARLLLDDRSATIRYRLGLAHYREGNLDAALSNVRLAADLDGQLADAFYLMGICLRETRRLDEAIPALETAVRLAPQLIPAREELADLLGLAGRHAEEIEQFQILASLDGRIERRAAVGLAHARAGDKETAVATLTSALEQAPDQTALYGALGRLWLDVAEEHKAHPQALEKALEALERGASATSATSEMKALYGRALLRDHQPEAAERMLQQATERYPVDPTAFTLYAEVAEQQRHFDAVRAALIAYAGLVSDAPASTDIPGRIGRLSLKLNDPVSAAVWLERASAAAPGDVPTVVTLTDALMRAGNTTAARAALARGLRLDPGNAALARRLS